MWTREELKSKAKDHLRDKWFTPFLAWGILGIFLEKLTLPNIPGIIFFSGPIEVGVNDYLVNNTKNKAEHSDVFMSFSKSYLNIVFTQSLRWLYTVLWTLLFIVPGIVKFYEYRMIPFILVDNPDIDQKEAFRISKEMTMENKMEMFILDLSFLGWYLLGSCVFGIGVLVADFYKRATYAELYNVLKEKTYNRTGSIN